MISLGKETILRYKELIEWTDTLHDLYENIWLNPIAEGKANPSSVD